MSDLLDIPGTKVLPVTAETVAHLPDQPLLDGVNGIAELSAHAAILSRKAPLNAERSVARQTEAAKALLAQLREDGNGDDEVLAADSIEGETNLHEAIEAALSEIDECEVIIAGLKAKETAFEARRKQTETRAERIRAVIEQAMMATDQHSMRLSTATISLSKRKPGLVIINDADIPAKFWVEQERPAPKLDKRALAEALAANQSVPGATLDNGSLSLSVRRK